MKKDYLSKVVSYYNQINEVPKTVWEELGCSSNLYFDPHYLSAIENNNSHLTFLYVVVKSEKEKAIALATIQIIDFYLDSLEKGFLNTVVCYGRKLKILPKEKPLKILNCGNPYVSGENGIFIKDDQNKKKILRLLIKGIFQHIQTKEYLIDIFIVKDFTKESLPVSNELISLGYYAFNVEPNMKMSLNSDWNSFEDYLASLKTKFRVKAKKALQLSSELVMKDLDEKNLDKDLKILTQLYKRVASKADFNLGEFDVNTYKDLKAKLGDAYILKSYWFHNKIVGFMSGMINSTSLDAHFVGIDYDLNRSKAIYQRMLYDYIDIAIQNKLKILNFGRTASEIKSSVGAYPEHLTIYIRHKKNITNKFLKLFLFRIQPSEFKQKFPFKLGS